MGCESGSVEVEEGKPMWDRGSDGWVSLWRKIRGFSGGMGNCSPDCTKGSACLVLLTGCF